MSAPDEFDPMIERLFARPPAMPDAEGFARRVEERLDRGWKMRTWALGGAGAVGGLIAVSQTVSSGLALNLGAARDSAPAAASLAGGAADSLWSDLQAWLEGGLLGADLSAMTGMQLFWLLTLGLVAAAAVTAFRAVNEG